MEITNEMVHTAYAIAKEVFEQKKVDEEGLKFLVVGANFKKGTARILLNNFKHLMNGEKFTRTMSAYATEYFIKNIYFDFGEEKLEKALESLKLHIEYYGPVGKTKSPSLKHIYDIYNNTINLLNDPNSDSNQDEQNEIEKKLSNKSRKSLIKELNTLSNNDSPQIETTYKSYKRENIIIAKIKKLRGHTCQICSLSIKKKNGKNYIEAAHITPKSKQGNESLENIVLLCPNHHKEFDLGNTKIINRNKEFIEFIMNDNNYKIKLSVEE